MVTFFSVLQWIGRQTTWLVVIVSLGCIVGGVAIYVFDAPESVDLGKHPLAETSTIYDRTGTVVLYEVHGEENRHVITHTEIPDVIRHATVATEDEHFYSHPGVDATAVLRAALINFRSQDIEQGASTITQQLARALFLTRERTWVRKVREAMLAVKIESEFTKDEILDLYLNTIPYGSNAYGIEAASQTYFKKDAKDLTLDEAALLAALPNAPTFLSPYAKNKDDLIARKNAILQKMADLDYISKDALQTALQTKTLDKIAPAQNIIIAPHFVFYVLKKLEEQFGRDRLETEGFKIITTLDLELQKSAERIVKEGAQKNLSRRATNAALVAVDPKSGDVLAMVGSRDYFDTKIDGQVNVAIQQRQPGSTFKPFAYATAFSKGFQPETKIFDVPINFGPDGTGKDYKPNDYDGKFRGVLTMREALAQSLNIPAVTTLYLAGIPDTIATATKMGITTLTDPKRYGLALVLGGAEVKLIDLTSAFGVFGQEGIRHTTDGVLTVEDRDRKNIYTRDTATVNALDPDVARKINSILSDNRARTPIFGPSSPLAFRGKVVAAKTGTTQNFRDAWTVGYTPSIAVGVWTGNNDNSPMIAGSDGIYTAAPIWRAFIDIVLERYPETGFTPYTANPNFKTDINLPDSSVVYISKKSGKKISAEKAKRKRQEDVELVYITDLSGGNGSDKAQGAPLTAGDLNKIYFPNGR